MLGEALLDLLRLLVGVHVQRELVGEGVAGDLLQPVRGTGTDGVRCEPDSDPVGAELLHLAEIVRNRVLPEAGQSSAPVRDVEEHERDAGCLCRLVGGATLRRSQVVELTDGRVSGSPHLAVAVLVRLAHELWRLPFRLREHDFSPRPEIAAGRASAHAPLERVAVGVDESGKHERLGHAATLPAQVARCNGARARVDE